MPTIGTMDARSLRDPNVSLSQCGECGAECAFCGGDPTIYEMREEIAKLRGELASVGSALLEMPYSNKGGHLVRWNQHLRRNVNRALGIGDE